MIGADKAVAQLHVAVRDGDNLFASALRDKLERMTRAGLTPHQSHGEIAELKERLEAVRSLIRPNKERAVSPCRDVWLYIVAKTFEIDTLLDELHDAIEHDAPIAGAELV